LIHPSKLDVSMPITIKSENVIHLPVAKAPTTPAEDKPQTVVIQVDKQ
jgi:hypothetical protein